MQERERDLLRRATAPARGNQPGPRAMLVYAHPDDEVIAVGGRLQAFANALFVQVTDGAPADNTDGQRLGLSREGYRAVRAREKVQAFKAGGLEGARTLGLGVPDKETVLALVDVTRRLRTLMEEERPEVIFTHPYERGHADHDGCAFAVHTAVALRAGRGAGGNGPAKNERAWSAAGNAAASGAAAPVIVECPFYFRTPDGTESFGERFRTPGPSEPVVYELSEDEVRLKTASFAQYPTQEHILAKFQCRRESYRVAPAYDFTVPPAGVPVESQDYIGVSTAAFCADAAQALQELLPRADFA